MFVIILSFFHAQAKLTRVIQELGITSLDNPSTPPTSRRAPPKLVSAPSRAFVSPFRADATKDNSIVEPTVSDAGAGRLLEAITWLAVGGLVGALTLRALESRAKS